MVSELMTMKRLLSTFLLLAFAFREADGQGFHRDCHDDQLRKLGEQLAKFTDAERAQHPELAQAAVQSREVIQKGLKLSDDLTNAWKTFNQQNSDTLARDPAVQQGGQQFDDAVKNLDQTNPESVRRYEKERDNLKKMVLTKASQAGLSQPSIDNANSAVNVYQRYADIKEAEFLQKRLAAGPAASESGKITDHVVKTAATSLPVSAENQALFHNKPAWSQALAAYAVANAISKTGTLPEELESAVKEGMVPFDTAGKVIPAISGDALVGRMGLIHLGECGATPGAVGAVETRRSMGPKTREAVAATAAVVLSKLHHVEDFSTTFRRNMRKEIVVPSPDIPPPHELDSVKALMSGVTKALKQTLDEEAGKLPAFIFP